MDAPPDSPIAVGQAHRTFRTLSMQVYDYDELGVRTRVLPAGSVFQPWEPEPHWRGVKVPITLGSDATGFGWGVTSPTGHFLAWHDFFSACGTGPAPARVAPGQEQQLEPFAELAAIEERLRARVGHIFGGGQRLAAMLEVVRALERVHADAAAMELGATGFDNMDTVRRYAAVQEHVLAAAREMLAACKRLVE